MGVFAAHRQTTARALGLASLAAVVVAGCGGGQRQDVSEPSGYYPVQVLLSAFPQRQHIARNSQLLIAVRNAGLKTIPNISVTVKCGAGLGGSFDTVTDSVDQATADPRRPQFIVDTIPEPLGSTRPPLDPAPAENSTAYVDTYTLGPLASGQRALFRWKVTPVRAGVYHICWRVNAGLTGKAKAVPAAGTPIAGQFVGLVSDVAPQARVVGPNDSTVITGPR